MKDGTLNDLTGAFRITFESRLSLLGQDDDNKSVIYLLLHILHCIRGCRVKQIRRCSLLVQFYDLFHST